MSLEDVSGHALIAISAFRADMRVGGEWWGVLEQTGPGVPRLTQTRSEVISDSISATCIADEMVF